MGTTKDPDGRMDVDADRGRGSTNAKLAEVISRDEAEERAAERAGFEELDAMVEEATAPGLNRLKKDRERITPRETNQPLGRAVMQRRLPEPGSVRGPVNGYQRKVRSRTRRTVDEAIPVAQYEARARLLHDPEMWSRINNQLSDTVGDVQAMPDRDADATRRVDRAIQAYEAQNTRGHVVYFNVEMPSFINHTSIGPFTRDTFRSGEQITFDRYTPATHQLHETAAKVDDPHGRVVVVEMQTRRGAYMGGSDSVDRTDHLLPRAHTAEVVGVERAKFTGRDGKTGERWVVQMRDVPSESTGKE